MEVREENWIIRRGGKRKKGGIRGEGGIQQ